MVGASLRRRWLGHGMPRTKQAPVAFGVVIDVLSFPSPDWSRKPEPRRARQALALNEEGRTALARGDLEEAEQLFMRAIESNPLLGTPWFNLGLAYKRQRRWAEAAACNQQAIKRGADHQDPAFWNLGIAATALRDWDTARMAWRGYGIEIPGDGPPNEDFGTSPVRLNPETSGEVVWGQRIDPARIVVENIPLPGSGHRWRDVILHDGEPQGERSVGDRIYPVFDELERWEASEVATWECLVSGTTEEIAHLKDRFTEGGWAIEDWTASVRRLCRDCSLGSVGSHHHGPFISTIEGSHVGIAAPRDVAETILDTWAHSADHRTRTDLIAVEN